MKRSNVIILSVVLLVVILVLTAGIVFVALRRPKDKTEIIDDGIPLDKKEYLDNSILKKIRWGLMKYKTDIKVFDVEPENEIPKRQLMNVIKDTYGFKSLVQEQSLEFYENGEKAWNLKFIGIDNWYEIYEINYDLNICESADLKARDSKFGFYQANWMPKEVIGNQDITLFSPTYLLYYLLNMYNYFAFDSKCVRIKDSENRTENTALAKCELIKDEKVKIEYHFKDNIKDNITMYPIKIDIFQREKWDDKWTPFRQIIFDSFKTYHNEVTPEDKNLPIGLNCKRQNRLMYREFDLKPGFIGPYSFDYDFSLSYLNDETKENVVRQHSGSMHKAQSVSNTSYRANSEVYVNYGVNEETNEKMITYYDKNLKTTFHDYYPDNDKCSLQKQSDVINWFYFQDVFVRDLHLLDFSDTEDYSYLGRYIVDEKECLVYERHLSGFSNTVNTVNQNDENGHSKNLNKIFSDNMIATYYYHKREKDFPAVRDWLSTPFRMEFRLKDKNAEEDVGKLIFDIKNYNTDNLDGKMFDSFENCIEKSLSYHLIAIDYIGNKKVLSQVEDPIFSIKRFFLQKISYFVTPLRMNKVEVKIRDTDVVDEVLIHALFRLYDPPVAENHFKITENEGFECFESTKNIVNINSNKCAGVCLGHPTCGAYSYDESTQTCKMCKIEKFNELLEKHGDKMPFSDYFKTIQKKESRLGKRLAHFIDAKHRSNDNIISIFEDEIKGSRFYLEFGAGDKYYKFPFKDMKTDRVKVDE